MIEFERILTTGSANFDRGICDLASIEFGTGTYLYSTSGSGGGLVVWQLNNGDVPTFFDSQVIDSSVSLDGGLTIEFANLGSEGLLVLDISSSGSIFGYSLGPTGMIGETQQFQLPSEGGGTTLLASYSSSDTEFIVAATDGGSRITAYHVGPTGTFTEVDAEIGRPAFLDTVETASNTIVVTADSSTHSVVTFQADTETGELNQLDNSDATSHLALNTPSSMEVIQAHGSSWVLVAGSGSNSISVMELGSDGSLLPTDHVLDSSGTKFNSIQDIAVTNVGDQVFVFAGGEDDGISLFALVPGGQLVHLETVEGTAENGLGSVDTLSVAQVGNELQVFAANQQQDGVSQFSVSLDNLGSVIEGDSIQSGTNGDDILLGMGGSTLLAGGGNDVLVAGNGTTVMVGGEGSDIFVVQNGGRTTVVTDFEVGVDRLDLSDFGQLRFPNQLDFTPTEDGAQIDFLGQRIVLRSADGGSLSQTDVLGDFFDAPVRLPNGPNENFSDTVSSSGITGAVTVSTAEDNPGIRDAEVHFIQDGSAPIVVQADSKGHFDLQLPVGSEQGHIEIIKSYSTRSQEINALDALQVLRMSVGLEPTWGTAQPENYIAADINRDGSVNAWDALDILRVSVGLPVENDAEWVFIDSNTDISGVSADATHYDPKISVVALNGDFSVQTTSILLGNVEQL
ncbi:beta-propeller fold lactonase family protein [Ruegeria arenilitoris]|uniref:beta-propeller fold lactonase family protein n=1 Tax=Ruegeria arenilitoris TaxID=1173585 RepID=UPI00147FEA65|nr:beta-propeller fold lactonase family protein [Ruegeria arenilitoris]